MVLRARTASAPQPLLASTAAEVQPRSGLAAATGAASRGKHATLAAAEARRAAAVVVVAAMSFTNECTPAAIWQLTHRARQRQQLAKAVAGAFAEDEVSEALLMTEGRGHKCGKISRRVYTIRRTQSKLQRISDGRQVGLLTVREGHMHRIRTLSEQETTTELTNRRQELSRPVRMPGCTIEGSTCLACTAGADYRLVHGRVART